MRLEARRKDEGGPYRWRPVVLHGGGLALGGIYDSAQEITDAQAETAKDTFGRNGYEWREL